jgi:signal transduction histidine kinase/ActR/RegA family two-component response regulator
MIGIPESVSEIAELLERARALESEVAERKAVEARLAMLAEASAILSSTLDYETTLQNIARLAMPSLGDFGFFDVAEPDGVRRIACAHDDPEKQAILDATRWQPPGPGEASVCALSSGVAARHPEIDDDWLRGMVQDAAYRDQLRHLGIGSMITVPLPYGQRVLGGLTLFYGVSGRRHTAADLTHAEEIGRRAGAAVENARLYRELSDAIRQRDEADRRKDEFLAMLGHELRNPLAPIMTALQLMDLRGDATAERERNIIKRQARHLTALVDDLLDISRVTRGKIALKKQCLEVTEVVAKAIESASPLLEQRRHDLHVAIPRNLYVDADPMRIGQVIGNLLTNAAKYTETGGHIGLQARREAGEVVIEVSDDGIGIPPEVLPTLFDPFAQGPRSMDRGEGGLGLGLALVKTLTQLHGGSVAVHSSPGHGSTFAVRLPAHGGAGALATGSERPVATLQPPHGRTGLRVLVVDDNVDAAGMLAEVLEELGHEVEVAYDGPQALEIAQRFRPTTALLDIGLPVMDGYELAGRLQTLLDPPPRLAAVTGYGQESDRERARLAGFDAHFVKPVNLTALVEYVAATAGESAGPPATVPTLQ